MKGYPTGWAPPQAAWNTLESRRPRPADELRSRDSGWIVHIAVRQGGTVVGRSQDEREGLGGEVALGRAEERPPALLARWLAMAYLLVFLVIFFAEYLPNQVAEDGSRIYRWVLLICIDELIAPVWNGLAQAPRLAAEIPGASRW